jgi:hypothetical protein
VGERPIVNTFDPKLFWDPTLSNRRHHLLLGQFASKAKEFFSRKTHPLLKAVRGKISGKSQKNM